MMIRCGMCGNANIKRENIKGTSHPWRDHLAVALENDQEVLVCQNCKNQILSSKDVLELDKNIRSSLGKKVNQAIETLTKTYGLSQQDLADALGITPEYISMVKNGRKVFSFTVFNLLQSYAENPYLVTKLTGIEIPNYNSLRRVGIRPQIGNFKGSINISRDIAIQTNLFGSNTPAFASIIAGRAISSEWKVKVPATIHGFYGSGVVNKVEELEERHQKIYVENISSRSVGKD